MVAGHLQEKNGTYYVVLTYKTYGKHSGGNVGSIIITIIKYS